LLIEIGTQIALSNLEVAFGGAFSLEQRRKMARESFQHFARTMVDCSGARA